MRIRNVITGILLGVFTSVPVMFLAYLGERTAGLPFVPFTVFDFMVRILPGFILIPSIHLLTGILTAVHVSSLSAAAKLAEQGIALVLFAVTGGIAGGILGIIAIIRRGRNLVRSGALLGLMGWAAVAGMLSFLGFPPEGPVPGLLWLGLLLIAWGALLGGELHRILYPGPEVQPSLALRRRKMHLAGALVISLLTAGAGLAVSFGISEIPEPSGAPLPPPSTLSSGPAASPLPEALAHRIEPAPGTRPEITAQKDFYRIDIDTVPPRVDGSSWKLEIGGLVKHPLRLSLDNIRARPAVSQYATMCCISNPVGGPLISTGLWTGVPLISLLKEAGIDPAATRVTVESVDGYYETIAPRDLTDPRTLLTYALNGEPLTPAQGFPLRFYIPNRYGMKAPKWISRITAIQEDGRGYWVDRGWDEAAVVQTMSVIDAVAVDQPDPVSGTIPMGGIAFAGDRGISRVEVQVDNGSWIPASLRTPPLSPLTWVQWRYDWPPVPGKHTVRVRAWDGTGLMQIPQPQGVFPKGATGYHSMEFRK